MFVQFKWIKIRLQLLCLLNILSKLAYSFCAKNCYCQYFSWRYFYHNTHTHTRLTALFPELPRWAGTRKVKPISILLKQETVTWQWHQLGHMQVCTLLQTDNRASTPMLCFFTGWMPFLPPNLQHQCTEASAILDLNAFHVRLQIFQMKSYF